jgi:predicted outer membrane lipoprotein
LVLTSGVLASAFVGLFSLVLAFGLALAFGVTTDLWYGFRHYNG